MSLAKYDVFVSYSREDTERARAVVEALRERGYRVFWDQQSIPLSAAWKQKLEMALRRSRVLLLCWSAAAARSEFVRHEYMKADALRRPIIPWLLDATALPPMLEAQGVAGAEAGTVADGVAGVLGWSGARRRAVGLLGAAVMVAGAVAYQYRPRRLLYRGSVVEAQSGRALAGVKVSCGTVTAYSNAAGEFLLQLEGEEATYLRLEFAKAGFQTEVRNVLAAESGFRMVMIEAAGGGR